MKKSLLSFAVLAMAFSANSQTVLFSEDFEWIAPWAEAGAAGETVEADNASAASPSLKACKVDDVTLYDAFVEKGYDFLACHSDVDKKGSTLKDRTPKDQIYVNTNYLKFGLTNYYSGIVFPAVDAFGEGVSDAKIAFDWSTQRQGNGDFDPVELVVIVKNGDNEQQFAVPALNIENGAVIKWYPTEVALTGADLNKSTRIIIRNCDEQWPKQTEKGGSKNWALRWFLDNVKITGSATTAAIDEIGVDQNLPVEYYNVLGVRVDNPRSGLYIVKQGNKVSKVRLTE